MSISDDAKLIAQAASYRVVIHLAFDDLAKYGRHLDDCISQTAAYDEHGLVNGHCGCGLEQRLSVLRQVWERGLVVSP